MAAAAVKINGRTPLDTYFSVDGKGFFASSGGGVLYPRRNTHGKACKAPQRRRRKDILFGNAEFYKVYVH